MIYLIIKKEKKERSLFFLDIVNTENCHKQKAFLFLLFSLVMKKHRRTRHKRKRRKHCKNWESYFLSFSDSSSFFFHFHWFIKKDWLEYKKKRDLLSSSFSLLSYHHQKETVGNNKKKKNWWLTTIIYRNEVKHTINWPHENRKQFDCI